MVKLTGQARLVGSALQILEAGVTDSILKGQFYCGLSIGFSKFEVSIARLSKKSHCLSFTMSNPFLLFYFLRDIGLKS